jgi:hypothetical protein
MNHLPRIGARAAAPCNYPVSTTFPVPPGIQFLSTIQPTSHLHLILIQLVFSTNHKEFSLRSHTLTHFNIYVHSYNFVIKTITDVDQPRNTSKDPLHVPNGPMTRSKTKALKEALNALVLNVSTKSELKGPLKYQKETLVHLIHVQEGSNITLFGP